MTSSSLALLLSDAQGPNLIRMARALMGLLFACAVGLAAAWAGQDDPRLGGLFDRLKVAKSVTEAEPIEAEIWHLWSQSDVEEVNLLMGLGVTAMSRQDYRTALSLFDQMVGIAPGFSEGWNKRATVYYLMGDFEHSLADVDRTLSLERHFGALSGMGLIYLAQEENEKALRAFERALAVDPNMPGPLHYVEELRRRLEGEPI